MSRVIFMLALAGAVWTTTSLADDRYFSTTGSDDAHCKGGTRSHPWRSLEAQSRHGCIHGGQTLILMPGNYDANSDFFFGKKGRINISGKDGRPVTLRSDIGNRQHQRAVFRGAFVVNGSNIIFSDIEFTGDTSGQPVLAVGGGRNVRIEKSTIRGPAGSWINGLARRGDCIKVVADIKPMSGVEIEGNSIHDCAEDAIDVNGAHHVLIRGNVISRSSQIQIKGGAKNITISENHLHHMTKGILGQGMDCSADLGRYCGSYDLLEIHPSNRFQAMDVLISNNRIQDLSDGVAIEASGWHRATIIDNRFENIGSYPQPLIRVRRNIGTAYTDDAAQAFCRSTPSRCQPCSKTLKNGCKRVLSQSRDVRVVNNTVVNAHARARFFYIEKDSSENAPCLNENRFAGPALVDVAFEGKISTYRNGSDTCVSSQAGAPSTPSNVHVEPTE